MKSQITTLAAFNRLARALGGPALDAALAIERAYRREAWLLMPLAAQGTDREIRWRARRAAEIGGLALVANDNGTPWGRSNERRNDDE